MRSRASLWAAVLVLGLSAGCKASASASINTGDKRSSDDSPPPPPSPASLPPPPAHTQFFGVARGLSLTAEAAATPACRCMAAQVGLPDSAAFSWESTKPTVGEDALVVAISNEGTPCDKPTGGRGPSIAGVEPDGSNVIVTLEEGRAGRPLARGAIFPRPQSDGWLVFRAARKLPYAQPLPGSADSQVCRIRIQGQPQASIGR